MHGLWCGLMVGLPRKIKLCARFVVWSHGWTTKEAKTLCKVLGVVSWVDLELSVSSWSGVVSWVGLE